MKKLLLGTAAVALAATFVAGPANAQVKLDLGGHTKMYGTWLDQDEASNVPDALAPLANAGLDESRDTRELDIVRDTEIHFTGETTLDNGLTVGFHSEATADVSGPANGVNDSFDVQESYAYFSGAWGRVNLGAEDGSTYLLQVAAPSADSNIDGIRQWVNPINHQALSNDGTAGVDFLATNDTVLFQDIFEGVLLATNAILRDGGAAGVSNGDTRVGLALNGVTLTAISRLDYDHAVSGWENKLTYMTPVFNGFQAGFSYTPELVTQASPVDSGVFNSLDDTVGDYGSVYELAARYEGMIDQVGVALGGGWSHTELERNVTDNNTGCAAAVVYQDRTANGCSSDDKKWNLDDREAWNVGIDLDWKAFGLGAAYTEDDQGVTDDGLEVETWTVGVDYTTGPFKIGASYLSQDQNIATAELEADRWTGGVIYTYGPGMTFRGSISYTDFEENVGERAANNVSSSSDAEATSIMLGTQINF